MWNQLQSVGRHAPRLAALAVTLLLTLPAPTYADRFLIVASFNGLSGGATWPVGWHKLFDVEDSVTKLVACAAAFRDADASEGGKQVKVTTANRVRGSVTAIRIPQYHPGSVPEAATAIHGVTVRPVPPSLTTSWGAADTLWLLTLCRPSPGVRIAERKSRAATEDPGPITLKSAEAVITAVIAIRGTEGRRPQWTTQQR